MTFSNKTYDRLKWIAQYFLPALGTLWIAVAKIWGLPYGAEIGGTIAAIDLFLGTVLGISSNNYKGDGQLVVNTDDPEKDIFTLEYDGDIEEIAEKNSVTFMVKK